MKIKEAFALFLKGLGMGAANVIPGVSGGTIALITGIFERLINAIKSFNITALKLLFKGKFREFAKYIDLYFLISLFLGIAVAILSVAKLFQFLFENYPIYIWSFFLGLVLTSVLFVGKEVTRWNFVNIFLLIAGTTVAVLISLLTPASENDSIIYLLICGIVAACSMILPGLSGSFVLILLGNYQLVMIDAVTTLNFKVLIPVVLGAVVGILAFSHFLSWVFKKYRNQTISILTGFVLGSVMILWPWKDQIMAQFGDSTKLVGYEWFFPAINAEFFIAIAFMLLGAASIWLMEIVANKVKNKKT